jgi:spore coat polysaccharide biosynthesis protein SpsF
MFSNGCGVLPGVVRLTGDCPIIDPQVVDKLVAVRAAHDLDYVGNGDPPSYPDGLDAEVLTFAALERTAAEAQRPSEREHVTLYTRTSGRFRTANVAAVADLSALRWTIDYPDDLAFVRALVDRLTVDPLAADMFDFLRAEDQHGPRQVQHVRNDGLARSLQAE